jgi:hypothetical protein
MALLGREITGMASSKLQRTATWADSFQSETQKRGIGECWQRRASGP